MKTSQKIASLAILSATLVMAPNSSYGRYLWDDVNVQENNPVDSCYDEMRGEHLKRLNSIAGGEGLRYYGPIEMLELHEKHPQEVEEENRKYKQEADMCSTKEYQTQ